MNLSPRLVKPPLCRHHDRGHFKTSYMTKLGSPIILFDIFDKHNCRCFSRYSLLAAGFFSQGHQDERLVIENSKGRYGVGRVEKKARQGY